MVPIFIIKETLGLINLYVQLKTDVEEGLFDIYTVNMHMMVE